MVERDTSPSDALNKDSTSTIGMQKSERGRYTSSYPTMLSTTDNILFYAQDELASVFVSPVDGDVKKPPRIPDAASDETVTNPKQTAEKIEDLKMASERYVIVPTESAA